jgi:hypothetical protein
MRRHVGGATDSDDTGAVKDEVLEAHQRKAGADGGLITSRRGAVFVVHYVLRVELPLLRWRLNGMRGGSVWHQLLGAGVGGGSGSGFCHGVLLVFSV